MEEERNLRLKNMLEFDARIEKINYDLIALENRKNQLEDEKINKQKEIEKLEKEKNDILGKTDNLKGIKRFLYIAVNLNNDLKRVQLVNTRLEEYNKDKKELQNKIDIQNNIYADTIKEKENYVNERRKLYMSRDDRIKQDSKVKSQPIEDEEEEEME